MTAIEEFEPRKAAEKREGRKQAKAFADCFVAAIRTNNCEALYEIGTCDDFYGGWRLALQRISRYAASDISPEIKETFQQVWCEKAHAGLTIDSPRLLCRALRRLLPPYLGPAVELYRGATLRGWRRGVSWSADIETARVFFRKDFPTAVLVKTVASPEAIICRIEYPSPFTEAEKAAMLKETPGCRFVEFHDEQEYIVDPEQLTGVEIVERG